MSDKLLKHEEDILNAIVNYTKTRDTAESVTGWGGYRPGAGRKSTGRKACQFYITEDERKLLKEYLEKLRRNLEMKCDNCKYANMIKSGNYETFDSCSSVQGSDYLAQYADEEYGDKFLAHVNKCPFFQEAE